MHRALRGVSVGIVLASALVANPPPGELLGLTLTTPTWAGLFGLAVLAGLATVIAPGRGWSYLAWALTAVPLLGPVHEVFTVGFAAQAVGAVGAVLHLELLTFETRRQRWVDLVADRDALTAYERIHRKTWARLGLVVTIALAAVAGVYAAVLQLAPPAFAASLEARQVEGMAAVIAVLGLLGLGVVGLLRSDEQEASP